MFCFSFLAFDLFFLLLYMFVYFFLSLLLVFILIFAPDILPFSTPPFDFHPETPVLDQLLIVVTVSYKECLCDISAGCNTCMLLGSEPKPKICPTDNALADSKRKKEKKSARV